MYKSGSSSDFPANPADSAPVADFGIDMTSHAFNSDHARIAAPSDTTEQYLPQGLVIDVSPPMNMSPATSDSLPENAHETPQVVVKAPLASPQRTMF
ncbi:MAG TPA: hypothetical protein EYN91_04215 [Candidatus Melainabacteria bacterium]|nr:hypothetical protein [Candidatus Melainabacteria bacterium]HIN64437.1 hypothetical protein [Candidatus Obscuribacterales bacterium]